MLIIYNILIRRSQSTNFYGNKKTGSSIIMDNVYVPGRIESLLIMAQMPEVFVWLTAVNVVNANH